MRRPDLLHLSAQLVLFGSLVLLFTQCEVATVDKIPSALTLKKGVRLQDPVVQTAPDTVKTIIVENIYDTNMAKASPKSMKPTDIGKYTPSYMKDYMENLSGPELFTHTFQWKTTGHKNVMVCIFKNLIEVDPKTNEISNKADLVWLWTPPQGTTDPGRATFFEGKIASWNKDALRYELTTPQKSLPDNYYIWFILAWDKQGINIIAASRDLPLFIRTLK